MNITPSIVAMGVAQTALEAQQQGRRRAAKTQREYDRIRQIQEVAEAHLRALDENDEGAAGVHVSITSDMPEHHTPPADPPVHLKSHTPPPQTEASAPASSIAQKPAAPPARTDCDEPLPAPYHHVDVQA